MYIKIIYIKYINSSNDILYTLSNMAHGHEDLRFFLSYFQANFSWMLRKSISQK